MRNPFKRLRPKAALGFLTLVALFTTCGKRPLQVDSQWSPPETFPASSQASVARWDGRPICIDGDDYYFLAPNGTDWRKRTLTPSVHIQNSRFQADPASSRFIVHDGGDTGLGNVRQGQLQARIACCSLDPRFGITTVFDRSVTLGTNQLLGTNTAPTCEMAYPPAWQQYGPPRIVPEEGRLGGSLILGNEVYVTFNVGCGSVFGPNMEAPATGPNQAGLLYTSGDGSRWTNLTLLDIDTAFHNLFATRANLYFLACPGRGLEKNLRPGLRSVRLPRSLSGPPASEIVAPTFTCKGGPYSAVAEGDTIHLVWLDNRHERSHGLQSMLMGTPSVENNWELYYRGRKDSEGAWTTEILLSKGLDFAFDPSMAVEGENLVVVWSGYARDKDRAYPRLHRSDIYLTVSRDGGKTWTPPARVTDNAKAGLASTSTQVALHRGIIHLFYLKGGDQLIYQRRPFPKD